MTATINSTSFNGIDALEIENDTVRLTVLPAWGGKIASLYDKQRRREWLFESNVLPYRLPHYGANYVRDFDVGGFDECFPTVGSCYYPSSPWSGTYLPDHGEVWSLGWEAAIDDDKIRLATHGVVLPYRLEKTISLGGDGHIRLEYRATNLTPLQMPFLWSSHPLFALVPGLEIRLPAERVRVFSAPAFDAHHGDVIEWPNELATVPTPNAGIAAKFFTPPLDAGWAELHDPADGAIFRFTFDPDLVTHIGLWINYGGWAGAPDVDAYFNIALEPCIGAPDTLDTAVNHWGEYGVLPAHGTSSWWLCVELE